MINVLPIHANSKFGDRSIAVYPLPHDTRRGVVQVAHEPEGELVQQLGHDSHLQVVELGHDSHGEFVQKAQDRHCADLGAIIEKTTMSDDLI